VTFQVSRIESTCGARESATEGASQPASDTQSKPRQLDNEKALSVLPVRAKKELLQYSEQLS
jgi:hypothetical protein